MTMMSEDELVTKAVGHRMKEHLRRTIESIEIGLRTQDGAAEYSETLGDDGAAQASSSARELSDEVLTADLFIMFMESTTMEMVRHHTNSELKRRHPRLKVRLQSQDELLRYDRTCSHVASCAVPHSVHFHRWFATTVLMGSCHVDSSTAHDVAAAIRVARTLQADGIATITPLRLWMRVALALRCTAAPKKGAAAGRDLAKRFSRVEQYAFEHTMERYVHCNQVLQAQL